MEGLDKQQKASKALHTNMHTNETLKLHKPEALSLHLER